MSPADITFALGDRFELAAFQGVQAPSCFSPTRDGRWVSALLTSFSVVALSSWLNKFLFIQLSFLPLLFSLFKP